MNGGIHVSRSQKDKYRTRRLCVDGGIDAEECEHGLPLLSLDSILVNPRKYAVIERGVCSSGLSSSGKCRMHRQM